MRSKLVIIDLVDHLRTLVQPIAALNNLADEFMLTIPVRKFPLHAVYPDANLILDIGKLSDIVSGSVDRIDSAKVSDWYSTNDWKNKPGPEFQNGHHLVAALALTLTRWGGYNKSTAGIESALRSAITTTQFQTIKCVRRLEKWVQMSTGRDLWSKDDHTEESASA